MRFEPGAIALTLFGWTPGLQEVTSGRALPCGCLVGVYATMNGESVEILDAAGENCGVPNHRVNFVLAAANADRVESR